MSILESPTSLNFVLFLRPFASGATVLVPERQSEGFIDSLDPIQFGSVQGRDIESTLCGVLDVLPVVALGWPSSIIGAGKVTTGAGWDQPFKKLAEHARMIVVFPWYSPGGVFEVDWLVRQQALERTVFVCPPFSGRREVAAAWDKTAEVLLAESGVAFPRCEGGD